MRFRGYNVYAYRTLSASEFINNQPNRVLVASYQADNFIDNLYIENGETGGIELADPLSSNRLPYDVYTDPERGRIRLRITKDPFTDGDLVKGKPYYFAVTSTAVNFDALVNRQIGGVVGDKGNYYLSSNTFVQLVENFENLHIATLGENMYEPPLDEITADQSAGGASGIVQYDVIDKDALTGNTYTVEFLIDSIPDDPVNPIYETYWRLTNKTTGTVLIDTSRQYLYGSAKVDLPLTDGFLMKLSKEIPQLDTLGKIQTTGTVFNLADVFYTSKDIPETRRIPLGQLGNLNSNYVRADQLRRVELRFTPENSGKAYRYLNGFFGSASQQQRFFKYAEAITAADTVNKGIVGEWDETSGRAKGFVDVPFTAWVKDFETGEERQLSVGFVERRASYGGTPDGKWNPGTNLNLSGEYIIVFNSTYDPTGSQVAYKGGFQNGNTTVFADLNGGGTNFYPLPETAPYTPQERAIASSPLFDILYAVGLQKTDAAKVYSAGDKVVIEVDNYPYTPKDVYTFVTPVQGQLTDDQQKELFEKVNVFPNPLYGYNVATSYTGGQPDAPFVTFSNLPEDVTIKIYSLSGTLLKILTINDKSSASSSFLNWDLQNESGLRVASGLYIAIVSSPQYGEKILKFSIIMPQKQIQRY